MLERLAWKVGSKRNSLDSSQKEESNSWHQTFPKTNFEEGLINSEISSECFVEWTLLNTFQKYVLSFSVGSV